MYVKSIMKTNLVTIHRGTPFYEARWIIQEKGIRHLPVVDERGRILGMVTNFDIRSAAPKESSMSLQDLAFTLGRLKAPSFMTPVEKLVTVTPETIIEKAVQLMHDRKVSCLPVLDKGPELKGLVTETDILETFVDFMGVKEKGSRLTVSLEDEPGKLLGVLEVIRDHKVNLVSIYSPTHKVKGKREVVLRLRTDRCEGIVKGLKKIGYEIKPADKWVINR